MDLKALGERVAQARRSVGLTQVGLAAAVSSHPTTMSQWERGLYAPNSEALIAIAERCLVSLDWLARGIGIGPKVKGPEPVKVRARPRARAAGGAR